MAIRNMRTDSDEILRKKSRPVEAFDQRLWELLDDMAETMAQHNGVGLAGVQVGHLRRLFIVDVGEGVIEFINPRILETSGEQFVVEGCLSFPGEWGMVRRPDHVRITAQDRNGKWFELEGDGLLAQAICHENDHLDGVVFLDKVERRLTEKELEEMGQD